MSTTSERPENIESPSPAGAPTSRDEMLQNEHHERQGRATRGRALWIVLLICLVLVVAAGGFFALGGHNRFAPFRDGRQSLTDAVGPAVTPLDSSTDDTMQNPVLEPADRRGPQSDRLEGRMPAVKGTRTPPADFAAAGDVEALRQGLDALVRRVDAIEARVSTIQGDDTVPAEEILAIRDQVAKLAPVPEQVASLTELLNQSQGQIAALGESLQALSAEVASIQTEVSDDRALSGASLNQAIGLFDRGQYDESFKLLQSLQETVPDDARVWYFSALAHAFASGNWEGGLTQEYFQRGVERERAGTPSSVEIDAATEGISRARGRDWIDFYRRRAQQ